MNTFISAMCIESKTFVSTYFSFIKHMPIFSMAKSKKEEREKYLYTREFIVNVRENIKF